jgi:glycosyltransferase involved in cell wall biosynthesis
LKPDVDFGVKESEPIAISFIVPIYNAEKYLRRCLLSIKEQSMLNIEIVMIDDGSADASSEICRYFANSDGRLIYHYQQNAGLSAARNKGLSLARGKYIAFVDADDFIMPEYAEKTFGTAEEENADIVIFGYKMNDIDGSGDVRVSLPAAHSVVVTPETVLKHFCTDWLLPQRMNYAWSKLYRHEFIKKSDAAFIPGLHCEDRCFNYQILFRSQKTVYISEALYFYYQHGESITRDAANRENLFAHYLRGYLHITEYWESQKMHLFDCIKPVVFLRMIQGALFNTRQTVGDMNIVAKQAAEAFRDFPLEDTLELHRLRDAINIYADICGLSWGEQTKIWLFALSLLDGETAMAEWQEIYPKYSRLFNHCA